MQKKFLYQMTGNTKNFFFFIVLKTISKFFGAKKYFFLEETKDFYFNPLNKIKWGPDERSASDFSCNFS